MDMDKIILGSKDKTPYERELQESEGRLNDIFSALGAFIPDPGMDDLADVINGGKTVKKRFADSVAETLAGIKVPSLKAEQMEKLDQLSSDLESIINKASRYKSSLIDFVPDSMIELRDGCIRFSSEAYTLIVDTCKIYIETDDQTQVYKLSRILTDVLNKLEPILKRYRCRDLFQSGVVEKTSDQWVSNNGYVANMPLILDQIKAHEELDRQSHERQMAERRAEEERTKHYITNPKHWPSATP